MRSFKVAIVATTALASASLFSANAHAQAPATDSEIVVTGSRIAQKNLEQATPITEASPVLIQNSGTVSLGDILSELPSLGFTGTLRGNSNSFGSNFGISSADLRNLGTSRTLVLVDGQRHVSGDINTDAVDLNSIPTALVDHVEIVTGGASALYGSDAVSGVVNIILKKKFDGVMVDAQIGVNDHGYGEKDSIQATVGHSFLDDHLHFDLTATYDREQGINANSIPNAKNYGTIINPADATCQPDFSYCSNPHVNNGVPDTLYVQNVGSKLLTRNGVLLNANTFEPQFSFNAAGQLVPVPVQTGYNSFAFGQLPANCLDCYLTQDYLQEASPFSSKGLEFRSSYDFNPHLRAFVDAKYVETDTTNLIQPSYSFGDYQLQPDNAFISPALATALAGTDPADYPYISKFLNPARTAEAYRRTYRIVAGVQGDFDIKIADVKFDAALNYGATTSHFSNNSVEILANYAAAQDSVIDPATGQAACRINVPSAPQTGLGAGAAPGCVAYNPFGINQLAGAMGYVFGKFDTRDSLTQQVANINLSADTSRFFNFPGGPLSIAVGAEYRMERTYEINDPTLLSGATEFLASNSAGGFNVTEAYIEGAAPVFKHNGFLLDELSLDAAYRGANYSFAQVNYADAYKFGAVYGPFSSLKFRGTYSQAIRAPNITEAFSPASSSYFNIYDPCNAENITANVNYAKNCAAAGLPAGFIANTNASIIGVSSGNAALAPETSFSYTGGVVIEPWFLKGFSVTADYYSIKIKNAITDVAAQDIINNCYNETSGLSSQYCSLFTRDPTTHNINFVSTTYVNASKLETTGLDVTASYTTSLAPYTDKFWLTRWATGRLSTNVTINYTFKDRNFPFQNDPTQVHILEATVSHPQMRGLATIEYLQGPWDVIYTGRYIGKVDNYERDPTEADFSESSNWPTFSPRFYHDIAVHYSFSGAAKGVEIYGGVRNIFGDLPPAVSIGTFSALDVAYDLGRYVFIGAKYKM
jgi:outer membrane receptor protein involved in Fe transport